MAMAMTTPSYGFIALDKIKTDFFVRVKLNDDRTLQLAEAIEAGMDIPPMLVTKESFKLVDGRHRLEAFRLLNRAEAPVEWVPEESNVELIAKAFNANIGGALPPAKADIYHTITLFIAEGLKTAAIVKLLPFAPSLARKYIAQAQTMILQKKMRQAQFDVADNGLTVAAAARKHGIDEGKLREQIRGKRKGSKKALAISALCSNISNMFKGTQNRVAVALRSTIGRFEDGDLREKDVEKFFKHIDALYQRHHRTLNEWFTRFEDRKKMMKEALKQEVA